ncbi:LexA/Signal peptidase [Martensiomyces pterosporus]|nr:LexA/Signal peptidase [Martensiomyces pterosporus]
MSAAASRLFWRRVTAGTVAAIPVAVFITDNVVSLQMISGRSMQPALNPDSNQLRRDVVVVDKMVRGSLSWSSLKRGDIITFTSPTDPDLLLVKRIIAMPHDCVVPLGKPDSFVRVPKGHCWVEGDESFHSGDSNSFGPIPLALVKGRAKLLAWPPSRVGTPLLGMPEWKKQRVFVNGTTRLSPQ